MRPVLLLFHGLFVLGLPALLVGIDALPVPPVAQPNISPRVATFLSSAPATAPTIPDGVDPATVSSTVRIADQGQLANSLDPANFPAAATPAVITNYQQDAPAVHNVPIISQSLVAATDTPSQQIPPPNVPASVAPPQLKPSPTETKAKRMSIFSVIHPALHAAFAQEKPTEAPASTPPAPLTSVDYRSYPLRGTESRDRTAIGLAASKTPHHLTTSAAPIVQEGAQAQPGIAGIAAPAPAVHDAIHSATGTVTQAAVVPVTTAQDGMLSSQQTHHDVPVGQQHQLAPGTASAPSAVEVDAHSNDASHTQFAEVAPTLPTPTAHDAAVYASTLNGLLTPRPVAADRAGVAVGYHSNVVPDVRESGITTTPTPAAVAAGEAGRALNTLWHSLLETAKRTADALGISQAVQQARGTIPSPSPSPLAKDYTEQDVTNLVNDILHEIQMQHEEMRAHRDMLASTGRWTQGPVASKDLASGAAVAGPSGSARVKSPMLVIRTSLLVPSNVLADAVATSTKRMLEKRDHPLSSSSASQLLTDVRTRLALLLEPGTAPEDGPGAADRARATPVAAPGGDAP